MGSDDADWPPELRRDDPLVMARRWFDDARRSEGEAQPEAAVLATVSAAGPPSARAVLVRAIDNGFVFYTNRSSRKGDELAANPVAALCSTWHSLHRQLRVEGTVESVDDDTSDDYWAGRPAGSRFSAAASAQSRPVASRAELADRVAELRALHPDGPPRPADWGGYRVVPERLEFWIGRPDRLHDRLLVTRTESGWTWTRLAP